MIDLVMNETVIPKIKLLIREFNFVKLYRFVILNKKEQLVKITKAVKILIANRLLSAI